MKKVYIMLSVALLLFGVTSSAGVFYIPSGTAEAGIVISSHSSGSCDTCSGNIGDTTNDATDYIAGEIYLTRFAISGGCEGTSLTPTTYLYGKYFNTDAKEVIWVAYSDNAGEPDSLIAQSSAYYDDGNSSDAWISDSNMTMTLSGCPEYIWLGIQSEGTPKLGFATSGGDSRRISGDTFGSPPSSWNTGADTSSTRIYNVYFAF